MEIIAHPTAKDTLLTAAHGRASRRQPGNPSPIQAVSDFLKAGDVITEMPRHHISTLHTCRGVGELILITLHPISHHIGRHLDMALQC